MPRQIPPTGINLFQFIYTLVRDYTEKTGQPALNLSLGNPDGIPIEPIRRLKAEFAGDPGYDYHTYAEDRNLNGFAERMVELHGGILSSQHPQLKALPIAGIKTATAMIPLACGLHRGKRGTFRLASNLPAYDVIGTWTSDYLGARRLVWPLLSAENMRLNIDRLKEAAREEGPPHLVFVIRPGNPAAVGASLEEWKALIEYCLETGARLVNDAAYAALAKPTRHVPLAAVAKNYPGLEWMELYSVSKSFNDPGARVGAMVGSRDFVEDYLVIKGNTDSGPVPSVMAAYGKFLEDPRNAQDALAELRGLYERRLEYLVPRLEAAGLRPACRTDAGFFTLWKVPRRVLGVDLASDPRTRGLPRHEAFNRLVSSETGMVGVHFQGGLDPAGDPLVRYAVCADVLDDLFQERLERQLARLQPEYD
ncbi:MAG: aminotransferase class I/II-fold pyridoxal phosphate-dependent enzyme [Elusimicrobia bacterium]|nr:aminotransferase class I/II-fold pyridoxal phosphate-dependent enzyme [Elusimicrobiota bacterium]